MSELNFCPLAIGLAATMMVLSPDTPVSFPKMYHSCAVVPSDFLPNTSFPLVVAVPLASGVNAVINWSFVAYAVTLGSVPEPVAACTVFALPDIAGTSPAIMAKVRTNAIPFLKLCFNLLI